MNSLNLFKNGIESQQQLLMDRM